MKVVFAGTPEFAAQALKALLEAGHDVPLVLTQPDRPAGRGMKLQASAVKQVALEHHIPIIQPRGLRLDGRYAEEALAAQTALEAAGADVMVVAAYGLILPAWVLSMPPLGCLNIHASVLPRWRGAAPIHRAIEAGDAQTGVTIMQMDEGLDTGDMLLLETIDIADTDTTSVLHDRLAALGARLIVQALVQPLSWQASPQPGEGITYAHKIEKAEAPLDWSLDAQTLARRIRAFNPFPGATFDLNGETIKVWAAVPDNGSSPDSPPLAGTVVAADASGLLVQTGQGQLCLTQLQRAGGKRLPVADFLRGLPIAPGSRLGT